MRKRHTLHKRHGLDRGLVCVFLLALVFWLVAPLASQACSDFPPESHIPIQAYATLWLPPWWLHPHAHWTLGLVAVLILLATLVLVRMLSQEVAAHTADVHEWLRREAPLRKQYQSLFENASDVIYTADLDGNITSLNRAGEQMTGYTREEALRMNIAEVIAPEHLERAAALLNRARLGELSPSGEWEVIAKDGRHLTMEVSERLITEGGKPVGVQGIARDITERKLAEKAVRESEAKFRTLFTQSPLPKFFSISKRSDTWRLTTPQWRTTVTPAKNS